MTQVKSFECTDANKKEWFSKHKLQCPTKTLVPTRQALIAEPPSVILQSRTHHSHGPEGWHSNSTGKLSIIVQLFNLILTYLHYSLWSWLAATVTVEHVVGWRFQPDCCKGGHGRSQYHQWVWLDPFSLYRCLAPNTSPVSLVPGGDSSASLPS